MDSDTADIAIVGAGPAGAWTAYRLASHGARVQLFDASHPREKPCGGGVTARALDLVKHAIDIDRLPSVHIRRARFVGESRKDGAATHRPGAIVPLPNGALVVASRREFDDALLAAAIQAGAAHVAARVRHIQQTAHGFEIQTTDGHRHRASALVGADGANSLVRRTLSAPFSRAQLSVATGFFARDVVSEEIVLELTANPPGYRWSFPRPDHLAIGVCAQADVGIASDQLRAEAAAWLARERLAPGSRLDAYAWPIPSLSRHDFGRLTLGSDRWWLVGDAAGLVDPITREGIFFALQSAEFAASAIVSRRSSYADQVHDEIASDLAEAARIKTAFFQPRFIGLMTSAISRSARLRAVLVDLVSGAQPYRTLKWRLLKTLEVGAAAKLLGWR